MFESRSWLRTTLGLAVTVLAGASVGAQEIPADAVLQGFVPIGTYSVELAGAELPGAGVFEAQQAGSVLLVMANELGSPILVSPRARTVESVPAEKVVERENGTLDILADANLSSEGSFVFAEGEVSFSVAGSPVRLKERPYLLGLHGTRQMLAADAGYAFHARQYRPSGPMIRALRERGEEVRVRVYFGTWCPHCKEMLPRILSVAKALEDSNVSFEYYGLPRPFGDEPEAARRGIQSVPTGVVYLAGREVGRIDGLEWKIPELAIKRLVD